MMGTERHGIRVAGILGAEVATGDYSSSGEPRPGGSDLPTIATHTHAGKERTATSGIRSRQQFLVVSLRLDAKSVIEGFGSTMCPAGTTVTLVSNVSDSVLTEGETFSSIEGSGEISSQGGVQFRGRRGGETGVHNSTHHRLDFLSGHTLESGGDFGSPGGLLGIDSADQFLVVRLF